MTWAEGFLVVDLETTDPDPATCSIVELGIAHYQGEACTTQAWRFHPGRPIPPEATAIHSIRDEDVASCPPFSFHAGMVVSLLRGRGNDMLVGYNLAHFDVPVLQRHLQSCGIFWQPQVVDLYVFVDFHLRHLRERKLVAMAQRYGVELANAHSAAADARACGAILLRMVEAGLVPADRHEAAAQSARLRAVLDEERSTWSYFIYRDRENMDILRLGFGKEHQGKRLEDVPPDFFGRALRQIGDLPPEVRLLFAEHAGPRRRLDAQPLEGLLRFNP